MPDPIRIVGVGNKGGYFKLVNQSDGMTHFSALTSDQAHLQLDDNYETLAMALLMKRKVGWLEPDEAELFNSYEFSRNAHIEHGQQPPTLSEFMERRDESIEAEAMVEAVYAALDALHETTCPKLWDVIDAVTIMDRMAVPIPEVVAACSRFADEDEVKAILEVWVDTDPSVRIEDDLLILS